MGAKALYESGYAVPELTIEQRELLAALRAALAAVHSPETFEAAIARVGTMTEAVIDLEWDPDTEVLELVGIGGHNFTGYDRFAVCQFSWPELNDGQKQEVRETVYALIGRAHLVYMNAAADIKQMRRNGFKLNAIDHINLDDVMLADAVLNSEADHDLGDLNKRYGRLPDGYKSLKKIAPKEYNAADLIAPIQIWRALSKEFAKDPAAEGVYRDMSLAYLREIQIEAEEFGVRVAKAVPYVLHDRYSAKREQAARLAAAYVGGPGINLGSSKDLKKFLFVVEGLPEQRERAYGGIEGKLTTDKDAIAALRRGLGTEYSPDDEPTLEAAWSNIEAGGHPLLESRYLFMNAQQAISHYIGPCLEYDAKGEVVGIKDRLYPETRLHVQASGRPSIVGPALQQFRGELLTLIAPDEGHCWVGWDWNRIEPRLLYYLANDLPGIRVCESGEDIYQPGIRAIFPEIGSPELEEMRRRFGKALILRIHYRGNPKNAGDIPGTRALGLKVPDLVAASERYLAEHTALPEHWNKVDAQIDRSGVVYTWAGRPRRLTNPHPAARYREGSNHLCQGGVADVYLLTALAVKRAAPWSRLVYGAHDAQTWQVPVERREEFRALIEPIVQREFLIGTRSVSFPATFKEREAP